MQLILVIALIFAVLVGFSQAPRDWRGERPLFSTHSVVLLVFGIYIPFPAVLVLIAGRYTWATSYYSPELFSATLSLCLAAIVSFLFGSALVRSRPASVKAKAQLSSRRVPDAVLIMMLAVGLALKLQLILAGGGLEDTLIRLSSFASSTTGVEELSAGAIGLRTLSGVADGAATWGLVQALKEKRARVRWGVIFTAVLVISYFTIGKRLLLVLPLVCIALAIHVYVRPLTTRLIPLVFTAMLGVGLLTLFARIFLPLATAGVVVNLADVEYAGGSALAFYFYSLEFSTVEMISVAMNDAASIADLFGGPADAFAATNLVPFLYSVPRSIWPNKPEIIYDISYGISATLGATQFQDPTVGYASTIIGTAFVIGGVLGVIGAMAAFGFLSARADTLLRSPTWPVGRIFAYGLLLVLAFHFFRQGTLGWTFIVSIVQQYGFLLSVVIFSLIARRPTKDLLYDSQKQSIRGQATAFVVDQ